MRDVSKVHVAHAVLSESFHLVLRNDIYKSSFPFAKLTVGSLQPRVYDAKNRSEFSI
jgi:hypothetical protein